MSAGEQADETGAELWSGAAEGIGREGLVTVWDANGRYAGCMGVNLWAALRDALTIVRVVVPPEAQPPRADYDPRVDYPERYSDGPY